MTSDLRPGPRVALLIDADNVSTDVIEQAVSRLHAEYGALHLRRAYGTAEAAVKHQALFKRLSIRPMVNLAAGKNSTDIALAVDALDLVIAERPDVVVIASSDSDFAPLVSRLREKGCLVRGIGQKGKVGEETPLIYDDWLEFEHRKGRRAAEGDAATEAPARATARRRAKSAAVGADSTPSKASASRAAKSTRSKRAVPAAASAAPAPAPALAQTPAADVAAAKTARGRRRKEAVDEAPVDAPAPPPAAKTRSRKSKVVSATATAPTEDVEAAPSSTRTPRRRSKAAATAATPPAPAPPPPEKVQRALDVLPQLANGETMDVQNAAAVLRKERVFSNADSWPKFFQRHADWFELLPPDRPTQVRLRRPARG